MTAPWPHLGSSGVIQDPGIGGAIGQSYANFAPLLQYLEQHRMAQERAQANQTYLAAQEQHLQFQEAERQRAEAEKARQATAVGQGIQALTQPQPFDLGGFSQAGGLAAPFQVQGPPKPESQALAGMAPGDLAALYGSVGGKEALGSNQKQIAQSQQQRQMSGYLKNLPPEQQADVKPIIDLYLASGEKITAEGLNAIVKAGKDTTPEKYRLYLEGLGKHLTAEEAAAGAGIVIPKGTKPTFRIPFSAGAPSMRIETGSVDGGQPQFVYVDPRHPELGFRPIGGATPVNNAGAAGAKYTAAYGESRGQIQRAVKTIEEMQAAGQWPTDEEIAGALKYPNLATAASKKGGNLKRALAAVTELANLQASIRGQRSRYAIESIQRNFLQDRTQLGGAVDDAMAAEERYQASQGKGRTFDPANPR